MLNQDQLTAAVEAIEESAKILVTEDDLVQTLDSIDDFIAAQGQPDDIDQAANGLTVHVWNLGRRTLAVVDFGEARAAAHL